MKYGLLVLMLLVLTGCSQTNVQQTSLSDSGSTAMINNTPTLPSVITKKLTILHNQLYVRDLQKMKQWYVDGLGFDIIEESDDQLVLGDGVRVALILTKKSDYELSNPQGAGLYHIAYVYDTRSALANRLTRVAQYAPRSFGGSADHNVSEAFYFSDPEGNGVELYYDRNPSTWQWSGGQVTMGSEYIDPNQYIQQYASTGVAGWHVGHNHLQVGDLTEARKFYADILGFDITSDMSARGALFVSAGGYHHHFGLNVWNSRGAGARSDKQLGLGMMTIQLEKGEDLTRLGDRLTAAGISFDQKDQTTIIVADPWNNQLTFTAQ